MIEVLGFAQKLRDAIGRFDPAVLTGDDCRLVAEALSGTAKACAAAAARAAARAGACGAHRSAGFTDASQWLARTAGTTVREAKEALEVATAVESCPTTGAALATGVLSLAEAREITRAEAARPGTEAELVATAHEAGLGAVRDAARTARLDAVDPDELHRRQHAARELRHWRDSTGMVRFAGALAPAVGVALANRLDAETDRIRRRAGSTASRREPRAAHAADALVALTGADVPGGASPPPTRRKVEVVVVCDLRAWQRGHAREGEPCHLIGGGPIPVAVARNLAGDAFFKAVVHDGVRIETVKHFGRHIPAELRTALEVGSPPRFDGVRCVEPGCGRRYGLEWDHVDPVAHGGPTSFANLAPRCWPHHRDKTERDRSAGLLGGGRPPPGPRPP